ncbi:MULTISPECIES: GAF domain-containing protein [unclassified Streptomyces]|uniref:GAF domain-containing protein n=1 Tax=unclassified Streptomyces TaxID=2593676 RepID=UPI001907C025|nr:GAF domain-containing protein [Streptomyces sp. HSG2]
MWPSGGSPPDPEEPDDDTPSAGRYAARAVEEIATEIRRGPPEEAPARFCGAVLRVLRVTDAGVSLLGAGLPAPWCAGGERAAWLAETQATLGEGPGVEAASTGAAVLVGDLTVDPAARRWPLYAREAVSVGVRASFALPLTGPTDPIGVLDLSRDTPGPLAGSEYAAAARIADALATALAASARGEGGEGHETGVLQRRWPTGPRGGHDTAHQAVGMIMAQLGIPAAEALARLRARAFARGTTVYQTARDVVAHRERIDPDR